MSLAKKIAALFGVAGGLKLDAAVVPRLSGSTVQVVSTQSGAVATGTTIMPLDDTIPQITGGNEYLTASITPTSATNFLEIEVHMLLATSAASGFMTAALFQDATANALAAAVQWASTAGGIVHVSFKHRMLAGTTSATTFRARAGGHSAGTTTFNGWGGNRMFGGVMASSITVKELTA